MKIAVIGSGISGLLAARLLADEHEVHVFEADNYAGGHTNTVSFEAFGQPYAAPASWSSTIGRIPTSSACCRYWTFRRG